jgi:hypothetical protein
VLRPPSQALGLLLLATATCGPDDPPVTPPDPPTCTTGFIGEQGKDPELELTILGVDDTSTPVNAGDPVPIIKPPQGGRVIFVGARARNIDACGVKLTGSLRYDAMAVRIDSRTVNLKPTDDGWVTSVDSDISTFANVPVCHNQWTPVDIFGNEFDLSLTIVDKTGRTVKQTVSITPTCAEPENLAECECICKGGYMLGEMCDGGGGNGGGNGGGGNGGAGGEGGG